jgi:hypothetical protein
MGSFTSGCPVATEARRINFGASDKGLPESPHQVGP